MWSYTNEKGMISTHDAVETNQIRIDIWAFNPGLDSGTGCFIKLSHPELEALYKELGKHLDCIKWRNVRGNSQ